MLRDTVYIRSSEALDVGPTTGLSADILYRERRFYRATVIRAEVVSFPSISSVMLLPPPAWLARRKRRPRPGFFVCLFPNSRYRGKYQKQTSYVFRGSTKSARGALTFRRHVRNAQASAGDALLSGVSAAGSPCQRSAQSRRLFRDVNNFFIPRYERFRRWYS